MVEDPGERLGAGGDIVATPSQVGGEALEQ